MLQRLSEIKLYVKAEKCEFHITLTSTSTLQPQFQPPLPKLSSTLLLLHVFWFHGIPGHPPVYIVSLMCIPGGPFAKLLAQQPAFHGVTILKAKSIKAIRTVPSQFHVVSLSIIQPLTNPDKRDGFPPLTSHFKWNLVSWHHATLDFLKLRK